MGPEPVAGWQTWGAMEHGGGTSGKGGMAVAVFPGGGVGGVERTKTSCGGGKPPAKGAGLPGIAIGGAGGGVGVTVLTGLPIKPMSPRSFRIPRRSLIREMA